ncbi:16S rRNA (cytosine(1402)-N(4))-methyltransferase RsmH [bacterium]|nr:16S rRNA (cytosine(1402)-N(4))-methyltransferase RsmH [candidate division CSSED10-310 bacterium]
MEHLPVMVDEVLLYLGHIQDGLIIDGTLGSGGHSEAILSATPDSVTVVGIDRDAAAVQAASARLSVFRSRFIAIHGNYCNWTGWKDRLPKHPVMGILLDLGLSSTQLESPGRGFSFRDRESLDMRFDMTLDIPTGADLVNSLSEQELADIIYRYGEDRSSRRIARAIVRRRSGDRFETALDLSNTIAQLFHGSSQIHPATRTFQALRIAVNSELDHLQTGLETAHSVLAETGRLVVISYHSLEDRIVKRFFIKYSGKCICPDTLPVCQCNRTAGFQILTRRPLMAKEGEVRNNPRSRSAKLRCAERLREKGVEV